MADAGPGRSARWAWGAVAVILLGAAGLVTYALTHGSTAATTAQTAVTAPGILASVSTVPASTFDEVGASVPGAVLTPPQLLADPGSLTAGGKPEVLFVGAEYCPFCAAERWPLILALSRFGRFTVLHDASSADQSVFPGTATFSFVGNRYSSPYLTFTGIELYSDQPGADGSFTPLAHLTPAQAYLVARYSFADATTAGTSPFVDVGGRMVTTTSGFSPALLAGQSQAQIASELAKPTASGSTSTSTPAPPTGAAIIAAANQLSVGICAATGGQPVAVCHSKGVRAAEQSLDAAGTST